VHKHEILASNTIEEEFVCNVNDPREDVIAEEYFGITTEDFYNSDDVKAVKKSQGGTITKPGDMSSIREHKPLTAFIHERKEAVKAYLSKVMDRVGAVHYD
jgi:hypothetical protein